MFLNVLPKFKNYFFLRPLVWIISEVSDKQAFFFHIRKLIIKSQKLLLIIIVINFFKRGTCICAHAWIFFKLCIIMTHYIQTMKMYLLN